MEVICRNKNQVVLDGTNLKKSNIFIVPYNKLIRQKILNSFSQCIHNNMSIDNTKNIQYYFNVCVLDTHKNMYYLICQLLKEHVLESRLNYMTFKRLVHYTYNLDEKVLKLLFLLFIKMRFFKVMHEKVILLIIKSPKSWDIHFVKQNYDQVIDFDFALSDCRTRQFLTKNIKTFALNIANMIRSMVYCNIGYTKDMILQNVLQLGTTTMEVTFALNTNPSQFMCFNGPYDREAIIIFYKIHFDNLLKQYKFQPVFKTEIQNFIKKYSKQYLKEVLQHIPDFWQNIDKELKKKILK